MELEWIPYFSDKDTVMLRLRDYDICCEVTLFKDGIDAIYYKDANKDWPNEKAIVEDIKAGRVARRAA
jgi:hypothetical protein